MSSAKVPYESAFMVVENPKKSGQLHFSKRTNWTGDIPTEQSDFQVELDNTCAVLKARFGTKQKLYREMFRDLLTIAEGTYNGDFVEIDTGRVNLESFKESVLATKAPEVKNEHLKKLALWCSYSSLLVALIAFLLYQLSNTYQELVTCVACILVGAVWGGWASFAIRNASLTFSQLRLIEDEFVHPWSRLLTITVLSITFSLVCHFEFVEIAVGTFSTKNILIDPMTALLFGLCMGLSERVLPDRVNSNIAKVIPSTEGSERAKN